MITRLLQEKGGELKRYLRNKPMRNLDDYIAERFYLESKKIMQLLTTVP